MRTNRPHPLPATLGIALAVFGGTTAVWLRSGPLDPRVALAGLVAAGGLTVALAAMIWARHRTEAALPHRKDRPGAGDARPGALVVVPLGKGQSAVIFDEPAAPPLRAPDPVANRRAAHRTADAIWAAVDEAVAAETPAPRRPRPGTPPDSDDGTR
jgi:hypothetical protein